MRDGGIAQRRLERVGRVLRKQGPGHLLEHGLPLGLKQSYCGRQLNSRLTTNSRMLSAATVIPWKRVWNLVGLPPALPVRNLGHTFNFVPRCVSQSVIPRTPNEDFWWLYSLFFLPDMRKKSDP